MKTISIFLICLTLLGVGMGIMYNSQDNITMKENKPMYQGPVPEGYDLDHYRRTGETIKLKE